MRDSTPRPSASPAVRASPKNHNARDAMLTRIPRQVPCLPCGTTAGAAELVRKAKGAWR